jgi:hypothetical protein
MPDAPQRRELAILRKSTLSNKQAEGGKVAEEHS